MCSVCDMLQLLLWDGVSLSVESAGSGEVGGGKEEEGQEQPIALLDTPREVPGLSAGQAEPVPVLTSPGLLVFLRLQLAPGPSLRPHPDPSHWVPKGRGPILVTRVSSGLRTGPAPGQTLGGCGVS